MKQATYEENGIQKLVISDKILTLLGSFVKEGKINHFYKFNFLPSNEEGLYEGLPWPALVILRYNSETGNVELYTVSTATAIHSTYDNSNTQSLTIENIVKLESDAKYVERTKSDQDHRIIGTPTSMNLGMIPGDHAIFENYSQNMQNLINAENQTNYNLSRLHIFVPGSDKTSPVKSFVINNFKNRDLNVQQEKGLPKAGTRVLAGVFNTFAKYIGGNKRTRRPRQSQRQPRFKKCTRRNKHTKGKTHKHRH